MTTVIQQRFASDAIQQHDARQFSVREAMVSPLPEVSDDEIAAAAIHCLPQLLTVARRYFACEADCHDAVQDAFLAALRYRTSFRRESELATWLHRIVINACLMKLRASAKRRWESFDADLMANTADEDRDPFQQEEDRQALRAAVRELSPDQRTVIQLRYFEGFSTEETAHILNLRPGAVKTRLHRSCRALRQRLERTALHSNEL